jgi:hypothetical protein
VNALFPLVLLPIIINPNAGPSTLKEKLANLNPISNQENFEVFIPK